MQTKTLMFVGGANVHIFPSKPQFSGFRSTFDQVFSHCLFLDWM